MQNTHAIRKDPVEDLARIANKGNDVYAGSLLDPKYSLRVFGDVPDDLVDAGLYRNGDGAAVRSASSGNLAEISQEPIRKFKLHACRKDAKAVSTAASLATPLPSASSIARSSSVVAE
ncbi:MAG: hypothetical protein JWQ17_4027 [Tardiphaga sp.]|nr:hypothetical protein [Tardiphaga sp.]